MQTAAQLSLPKRTTINNVHRKDNRSRKPINNMTCRDDNSDQLAMHGKMLAQLNCAVHICDANFHMSQNWSYFRFGTELQLCDSNGGSALQTLPR
jgi:hypothetical protein